MSGLKLPGLATTDLEPAEPGGVVRDVLWVAGTFVVLAVVAGLVWWQLAQPPYFVRTSDNAVMEQAQLGRQVRVDGLFVVAGLVGGLVAGFGLVGLRRRDPLVVLLLGVAGSVAAGLLALWLGELLGHRDVQALVRAAQPGAHVSDTLKVISRWVVVAWPFGFLIGAVSTLLGRTDPVPEVDQPGHTAGNAFADR